MLNVRSGIRGRRGGLGFLTPEGQGSSLRLGMIARVTLELALRREFDYLVPPSMEGQVEVGSRVQVPLGARKVMGCVTAVAEKSDHPRLKPILKVIGAQSLVTPSVLKLARWMA